MKLITVLSITFIFIIITSTFAQNYEWAKRIGGAADQYANDMVVDNQGNVYIVGVLQGTNIDFDPGIGTAYLSSAGMIDIFIAKYDPSGNYMWAKRIGGTSDDIATRIKIDHSGNIYISGWFSSTNVDFDPGSGNSILSSAGSTDIFFAKYDKDGNYVWAKRIGTSLGDGCHDIDLDYLGNVYITGYFYGTNTDFDPGPGTALLSSVGNSGDVFFAKYDSSGNYLWAKSVGGSSYEVGNGITVDGLRNVYLTGPFSGTDVDFDPGPGTAYLSSAGGYDVFFAKYDSSGNYLWAKGVGGTGDDIGGDIVADSLSNIYIPCYFHGTSVDFDPGPGTSYLSSAGGFDIGLAKYDASGNYLWANRFGGPGDDYSGGILLGEDANIYFTGSFTGTNVDFDPGPDTAYLNSNGNSDIFFAKYNSLGEYLWAASIGGSGGDNGTGIAVSSSKRTYISGGFSGTNVDFDPGSGSAYLSSAGGMDIFIAKYYDALYGPYLGQIPPDSIPKRFPPSSLLSNGVWWWHGTPMFSPDLEEMYWTKYLSDQSRTDISYMKLVNNEWTSPDRPSFASETYSDNNPFFSPTGESLYFHSTRPGGPFFIVTKDSGGWSQPQPIDIPIPPGSDPGLQFSLAKNGTIYFELWGSNNQGDIYRSRLVSGQYSQPEKLADQINTSYSEWCPYIHPEEEYIIFTSDRPGGFGSYDLYISFRNSDGSWTAAQNLGSRINGTEVDVFPMVTPDGLYFFFTTAKTGDLGYNPYWMDASFLCRVGDADNSGSINISDVIYLINYLFKGGPEPEPEIAGDSNNDNKVTVSDVVYLINYLLKGGPKPNCE